MLMLGLLSGCRDCSSPDLDEYCAQHDSDCVDLPDDVAAFVEGPFWRLFDCGEILELDDRCWLKDPCQRVRYYDPDTRAMIGASEIMEQCQSGFEYGEAADSFQCVLATEGTTPELFSR